MLTVISARIGSRPRRSLALTLVFVIVAGVVGGPITGALKSGGGFAPSGSDSQEGLRQAKAASGADPTPGITLLVRTRSGGSSAAGQAAIDAAARRLRAVPGIVRAVPTRVAPGGHEAFVEGTVRASTDSADVSRDVQHAFAGDRAIVVGGSAVAGQQVGDTVTKDLGFAEAVAAPLLVLLSILFFRGRATLMPLIVGVTTVLGTFLVLTGVNQLYNLSIFALNLVIGSGLGLAVDYTLFIVTRFREELERGASTAEAIAVTMRRAGSTVVFSALTVAGAAATMILFPEGFLKSMGIAGAITALVAAAASVLISPALLALWGPKLARRVGPVVSSEGRWYRFSHAVMRRPGIVATLAAAAMLAAGIPALSVTWSPASDSKVIPHGDSSRVVADALTRDFGASTDSPVSVVIAGGPGQRSAVAAYGRRIASLRGVDTHGAPGGPPRARYLGRDTWLLAAQVHGDSSGPVAQRAVNEIRRLSPPFRARVIGDAATFVDQQNAIATTLPLAIGLLVALEFSILWLMTGSFVLPIKAIAMNALTVGAALSAIVVVYQHGHLTGLLHYTPNGGVEPTDFVVAATVVFALSTDYGVFLLGRIKEARDAAVAAAGSPRALGVAGEREAVATGLGATGRVVTAAAILLAVAIGAFSTSEVSFIQQVGVAVGLGVLIDAFVVRSLLVPSLMALLGHWNWWSPAPVRRLHARLAVAAAG